MSRPKDGGPVEAAEFVAEALENLVTICHRHRLETLAYLLSMAQLEANEVRIRPPRRR